MVTAATINVRPFEFSRVVGGAVGAVGQDWATYMALAAIFVVAPTIALHLIIPVPVGASALSADQGDAIRLAYARSVLEGLLSYPFVGGVTAGVLAYMDRRRLSFQGCFTAGVGLWLPLIALNFIIGLIQIFALLALVIPALVLAVFWIVATPVRVAERLDVRKTLARSQALTKGRRGWVIVAILSVGATLLALWLVSASLYGGISGGIAATGATVPPAAQATYAGVLQACIQLVIAAGLASLYHELRVTRDGLASAVIADTFS